MSTRYVWSRYSLSAVVLSTVSRPDYSNNLHLYVEKENQTWSYRYEGIGLVTLQENVYVRWGNGYSFSNGKFKINNSELVTAYRNQPGAGICEGDNGDDYYLGISTSQDNSYDYLYRINAEWPSGSGSISLGAQASSTVAERRARITANDCESGTGNSYKVGKGSYSTAVSNAASSTYPQDGVSGNYWYELQGSDNIDAAAVGYSNQAPMGGQPITINVTAGTGKVYGGTVRYTYQVQLDNGSWQTIATNIEATSQEYTIPAGTTAFAARVLASDELGFSSSNYTTGATLSVTNNVPPSAPASISFTEPVAGGTCTITWGAASDSDGTVTGYELERNVDGGDSWTQIYSGSALSYEDDIDPDWATVNYRVRAVDDDGDKGTYATSTAQAINDGWLYFSGPDEDMGTKSAPFDFAFAINSTPAGAQGIDAHVYLDDDEVYSGTPDAAEQVSVHVDMRPMRSGEHVIVVTAECGELLGVNKVCKFAVPEFELPDGGRIIQLEDSGGPIFPQTIVSAVKGSGGQSVAGVLEQSYYSTYIGTGTSGQGNPCQTRLAFHPSLMIIQASGNSAAAIGYWVRTAAEDAQDQGNMVVYNGTTQTLIPVRWDEDTMTISYYGNSAAEQLNASGVVYGIRIL